jgi:N-acyl-D-aspartate/D-glutamate deacylase
MEREIETGLPDWEGFAGLAGWDNIVIVDVAGQDRPDILGRSVAELATEWSCTPFAAAVRLLLDFQLAVAMVVHAMLEDDVIAILRQPWRMGGTDALLGGRPHPRAYGSYPRILGHYARDAGEISLQEAVRQMTGAAAHRLGMKDRGVIAPGMKADLCAFDAGTVNDRATFSDPMQPPVGIAWVMVNGSFVLQDGQFTGDHPGKVLRAGE